MDDINGNIDGESAQVPASNNNSISDHVGAHINVDPNAPIILEDPAASLHLVHADNDPQKDQDSNRDLVEHGTTTVSPQQPEASSQHSSEDEKDEELLPAGPIDPERCTASGPGLNGGAAGAPLKLTITAKDSSGRRLREGGAYVLVVAERTGPKADDFEPIEAAVVDHKDGTYAATYSVPEKGNYELSIEINGSPIQGSPFPVFFSAAGSALEPSDGAAAEGPATAAAVPAMAAPAAAVSMPPALSAFPNIAASQMQMQISLGSQATQMGVSFPNFDDSRLKYTVIVGGVSPFTTEDALRGVFALCGAVKSIRIDKTFAFVEFGSEIEANAAIRITGMALQGQTLRVENAFIAKQAGNPYAALQAQQMQAYQMMHQQQTALAQQIAQLRASTKSRDDGRKERRRSRSRSRSPHGRRSHRSKRHRSRSRSRSRDRERRRHGHKQRHRSRSRSRDRRDGRYHRDERKKEKEKRKEEPAAVLPPPPKSENKKSKEEEKRPNADAGDDLEDLLKELDDV